MTKEIATRRGHLVLLWLVRYVIPIFYLIVLKLFGGVEQWLDQLMRQGLFGKTQDWGKAEVWQQSHGTWCAGQ